MKLTLYALTAMFGLVTTQSFAQYITTNEFQNPHSISNEGLVAGYSEWAGPYYIWNPETNNLEAIGGIAPGNNHGGKAVFSDDGKYLSGTSKTKDDSTVGEMSRYNIQTKQWETLGYNYNTGHSDSDFSSGYYLSGNGKTVVGLSYIKGHTVEGLEAPRAIAYVWNQEKGNNKLETYNPNRYQSRANAVSNDGSVVVGWEDMKGPWKSHFWKKNTDGTYQKGQYILIDPKGNPNNELNQLGEAREVSGNGKWIGGKSDAAFPNAWIWSEETGIIDLGRIATPEENNVQSWVTSISYDGSVVLGYSISKQWIDSAPLYTPFIWTKKDGLKDFNEYVTKTLKFDLKGDKIFVPTQLSSNEKYIVGWSVDEFAPKVFRIQLPDNVLSTDDIKSTNDTKLYPNPVSNSLNIESKENVIEVLLYSITGQVVFSQKINKQKATLDISNLKTGVYITEIRTATSTETQKIIKK